jgi:hypothetical protein
MKTFILRHSIPSCFVLLLISLNNPAVSGQPALKPKIIFVNNFYENASPLNWSLQGDSVLKINLLPDYERESLNRQTDHWNFRISAETGTHIRLVISKLQPDVYNNVPATDWWNFSHPISCYISYDQKKWQPIQTSSLPNHELLADFVMAKDYVYVARLPVYTVSDLENLEAKYRGNSLFKILTIGSTIEKRTLEIIRLGKPDAPYSVIIRARAHPWEPGGNWVVEGLINKFISRNSEEWKKTFCVYIMPMANKDGVARGMTRFNTEGMDLNRKWDKMSDPEICPEKYALEKFIEELLKQGIKPSLGIDIHNDDAGGIDFSTHKRDDTLFIKKMKLFEQLMRENTLFSEEVKYSWENGDKPEAFVLFQDGIYKRYNIEALVWELNANWIGGLKKIPSQDDWLKTGESLNEVFYQYFKNKLQ